MLFPLQIYTEFACNDRDPFCDFVGYGNKLFYYDMVNSCYCTENSREKRDFVVFGVSRIHTVATNCGVICVTLSFNK